MALQLINIGNIANDGTGDDLREAMIKINQNFEEIDLKDPDITRAANIGAVGEGVFAKIENFELQFKKLVQGSNITLTSTNDQITIDAVGGLQNLLITSDEGSLFLKDGDAINLSGGIGITTRFVGNNLIIENTTSRLQTDASPVLSANLNANNFNINNVNTINSAQLTGNLAGTVYDIDIRDIKQLFNNYFDFGEFVQDVNNFFDWFISSIEVDLGTLQSPSEISIDMGNIV
jgi:hypothetical protein